MAERICILLDLEPRKTYESPRGRGQSDPNLDGQDPLKV
jgi:hypothetical protein